MEDKDLLKSVVDVVALVDSVEDLQGAEELLEAVHSVVVVASAEELLEVEVHLVVEDKEKSPLVTIRTLKFYMNISFNLLFLFSKTFVSLL